MENAIVGIFSSPFVLYASFSWLQLGPQSLQTRLPGTTTFHARTANTFAPVDRKKKRGKKRERTNKTQNKQNKQTHGRVQQSPCKIISSSVTCSGVFNKQTNIIFNTSAILFAEHLLDLQDISCYRSHAHFQTSMLNRAVGFPWQYIDQTMKHSLLTKTNVFNMVD
jgi:hypothetical protein